MKKAFTTLEMLVAIVFLCVMFFVFFAQKEQISQKMRDQERKASVNSIYFNLINVYFKQNGYYPEYLKSDSLTGVDPAIFSDPNKILLGDQGCDYEYKASNCVDNHCESFTISARLETEADYSKSSK